MTNTIEHATITIEPEFFEFSVGGEVENTDNATHVALHVVEGRTRTTIAMLGKDAEAVGRLLIAHADYVAGRPVREW